MISIILKDLSLRLAIKKIKVKKRRIDIIYKFNHLIKMIKFWKNIINNISFTSLKLKMENFEVLENIHILFKTINNII